MSVRPGSSVRARVEEVAVRDGMPVRRAREDALATEEPLEIRLVRVSKTVAGRVPPGAARPLAVTMRTPGADFELAAGFLFAEGIVARREDVAAVSYCTGGEQRYNVVNVVLADSVDFDLDAPPRPFLSTSACGVCGKASIEAALGMACESIESDVVVDAETLLALPARLREAQAVFERTGGLHAAALFTAAGELLRVREDVGRHNALDKLVGASLLAGELPLGVHVVLVSGRLSFELAQKAARAGVAVLAGVSAPSSLAVDTARSVGMTLVGFLRESRFNVYAGGERIAAGRGTLSGG
ncbi:MAG: formate dehydrogenase family accessory protein FdhD [Gemmatimonadetes bacterium]|nr:formate dehydrogenase family accessory protein FdhD [Gemmatimonadota bacterium]